jgi:hypothetical protein
MLWYATCNHPHGHSVRKGIKVVDIHKHVMSKLIIFVMLILGEQS